MSNNSAEVMSFAAGVQFTLQVRHCVKQFLERRNIVMNWDSTMSIVCAFVCVV